jgi:hypothetical protein
LSTRRAKDRVEPNGVQIDHFIRVTGVLQPCGELLQNGMAKRLRIRMSEYRQNLH